ncbi:UDP-Glycosyltransferase/glycogen phosphorylase [Coniochaeta ligniaria NRRL 30616]|uniref:UDP-Glycosyltransferase/glycogen phosphorylase n=1 Tax=Coniochaeta ligniaria NRRL 30616 TaxID=1408157 RepID=A0A1J7I8N6_9PEZI|nr:UDP-Glycosyltransferase/glycogen phosphorylase [Coniochaeta ligniaria NRRL 30616]
MGPTLRNGNLNENNRFFILFVCHPLTGHLTPAIKVAEALCSRGWPVFFLGPTAHKARITRAGVTFIPLQGSADHDDLLYYSPDNPNPPVPDYWSRSWAGRALVDVEKQWLDPIPDQWTSVKAALSDLQALDPQREVIVIAEAVFHGLLPLFYGAKLPPGLKRPRATLALSVTVPLISSAHLPPFGFSLPYDADLTRSAQTLRAWRFWARNSVQLKDLLNRKLLEAGATTGVEGVFMDGEMYTNYDTFMQLGVPGFFFPRTDAPASFRFVGIIPAAKPASGWGQLPEWWDEIATETRRDGIKVVVVAQGTVETDPWELILPTIWAMSEREDVLVVAILGRKGATLPAQDGKALPSNARVTDYLHYDAVLPHAHAWVHNGGYGAVQHGIANGVPMVVAGEGQDKTENAKRMAYSGAGVSLGTAKPEVNDVRRAVEAVLDVPSYRERVELLRKEAEELDCYSSIERAVVEICS